MDGRGKSQNLNNFAPVSRGILRAGPWNLAKFATENSGLYSSLAVSCPGS